jgi:hypothetical protein
MGLLHQHNAEKQTSETGDELQTQGVKTDV